MSFCKKIHNSLMLTQHLVDLNIDKIAGETN